MAAACPHELEEDRVPGDSPGPARFRVEGETIAEEAEADSAIRQRRRERMNVTSNGVIRRNAAERAKIIELFRASGLSQRQFCEREGVSAWSLRQWLSKAEIGSNEQTPVKRKPRVRNEADNKFIEICNPLPGGNGVEVELSLPGGISLRIRR